MSNPSPEGFNRASKNGAWKSSPRPSNWNCAAPTRACLSDCLDTFREAISAPDRDLSNTCDLISSKSLRSLYCCDSRCDVHWSPREKYPNVNKIVQKCKRVGRLLEDPGPPKVGDCGLENTKSSLEAGRIVAASRNTQSPTARSCSTQLSRSTPYNAVLTLTQPTPSLRGHISQESARDQISSDRSGLISATFATPTSFETDSEPTLPYSRVLSPTQSSFAAIVQSTSSSTTKVPIRTSMLPSNSSPANNSSSPSSLWSSMGSGSQAGLIIGLCLLAVCLIFIILFFLDRHKRRQAHTFNPKTRIDSCGVRWPEQATLEGDAMDFHTWTQQYEREYRYRTLLREGQHGIEMETESLVQMVDLGSRLGVPEHWSAKD